MTTWPFHRSGWRHAIDSLRPLHNDEGVLLVDVIDRTFGSELRDNVEIGAVPIVRPWVGFLHNPPGMPGFAGLANAPQTIVQNHFFRQSLATCRGIFTLSRYLRDWLAPRVDVPVVALMHPTEDTSSKFCYESFVRQSRPCLVQVGAWLRNFRSLKHIDAFPFRKVCIDSGPRGRGYQQLEESYQDVYNTDGLEVVGDYEMIDWLDKDQFDDLMAHSIVFLHLYDASASNTIIECIRRHTPVLVNPLPAVKEYLGQEYPLYFSSLDEAACMLRDTTSIAAAHEYLARLDDSFLDGASFRKALKDSDIYRHLPVVHTGAVYSVSDVPPIDSLGDLNVVAGHPLSTTYAFIVCMRNQEGRIDRCIRSILNQPARVDYGVVVIDDMSDDAGLEAALARLRQSTVPHVAVRNLARKHYCRNLYNGVHSLVTDPGTVCIEVNGDDYLADVDVLAVLDEYYATGTLKTFGDYDYKTDDAYSREYARRKPAVDEDSLVPRNAWNIDAYPSWMHLRTYTKALFEQVPKPYFWERGGRDWLRMNEDLSIHPKMVELAGQRVSYIDEVLYIYDISGMDHDHREQAWGTYVVQNFHRVPMGLQVGHSLALLRARETSARSAHHPTGTTDSEALPPLRLESMGDGG